MYSCLVCVGIEGRRYMYTTKCTCLQIHHAFFLCAESRQSSEDTHQLVEALRHTTRPGKATGASDEFDFLWHWGFSCNDTATAVRVEM